MLHTQHRARSTSLKSELVLQKIQKKHGPQQSCTPDQWHGNMHGTAGLDANAVEPNE